MKILDAIHESIRGLLVERQEEIFEALSKALQITSEEGGKFKFPISMKSVLEPQGNGWNTQTNISFSVIQKASTEQFVDDSQGDLVDTLIKGVGEVKTLCEIMDTKKESSPFYEKTYLYNTPNDGEKEIGVLAGLGDDTYIVGWLKENGARKRIKSNRLPVLPEPVELQVKLDAWAIERGLVEVVK
jgi:hypothetical protein